MSINSFSIYNIHAYDTGKEPSIHEALISFNNCPGYPVSSETLSIVNFFCSANPEEIILWIMNTHTESKFPKDYQL
jgi:hypothetical protein